MLLFPGLCYAEFAARVPKAGSAYVYSYVSVGEFIAFTIGWNLILEYVIGTASVAKGMANYIDSLCNNTVAKAVTDIMPISVSFLGTYPDFLAFVLVLLITSKYCFILRVTCNQVLSSIALSLTVLPSRCVHDYVHKLFLSEFSFSPAQNFIFVIKCRLLSSPIFLRLQGLFVPQKVACVHLQFIKIHSAAYASKRTDRLHLTFIIISIDILPANLSSQSATLCLLINTYLLSEVP
jgi:hypothetical protein